ncbi:hypothetical protein ABPG75_003776 [Micractinium tetrahymenae]
MQPECCGHCLHDLPVALTYALCDNTRRNQLDEPYQPWWPADIDSPTLYFQLKRRAMEYQCREQARLGPCSDPSVWRAPHTSAAAGRANPLLASRGRRQLSLRLPAGRTNLTAADELEFVGVLQRSPVPPQAQQAAMQEQQQAQQQAVMRPRRTLPPAPTQLPAVPALKQEQQHHQPEQLLQPSMNLLASLQHHEQCHRQQLAAAWGSCAFLAAEAHPAACLRPQWQQDGWEAQQQLAAALQQQLAAAAAAAAASAGGWPYSIPQQQQGGWASASRLAPQPGCQGPLLAGQPLAALTAC